MCTFHMRWLVVPGVRMICSVAGLHRQANNVSSTLVSACAHGSGDLCGRRAHGAELCRACERRHASVTRQLSSALYLSCGVQAGEPSVLCVFSLMLNLDACMFVGVRCCISTPSFIILCKLYK